MQFDMQLTDPPHPPTPSPHTLTHAHTSTSQHQELLQETDTLLLHQDMLASVHVGQEGSGGDRGHIAAICAPYMFTLS